MISPQHEFSYSFSYCLLVLLHKGIGCIFSDFFFLREFSCENLENSPMMMKSHISSTFWSFLHCELPCDFSKYLHVLWQSYKRCIYSSFPHYEFYDALSCRTHLRILSRTGRIYASFHHYVSSYVSSDCLTEKRYSHRCDTSSIDFCCRAYLHRILQHFAALLV